MSKRVPGSAEYTEEDCFIFTPYATGSRGSAWTLDKQGDGWRIDHCKKYVRMTITMKHKNLSLTALWSRLGSMANEFYKCLTAGKFNTSNQ